MIKIIDILSTEYSAAQPTPVRAHLIADTTADLPAPTGITGYQLTIGSICDVIADSTRYTMQSSGTWVQTLKDITADVYTKAQVDAMITAEQTARSDADTALSALQTVDRAALAFIIDRSAKNLLDPEAAQGYNYQGSYPSTIAGVTYTLNPDGSITTSGSTSATRVFKIPVTLVSGTQYTISGCPAGGSDSGYRVDIRPAGTTTVTAIDYGEGATFTADQTAYDLCIRYPSGKTPAETFYLMITSKAVWDITKAYVKYSPAVSQIYTLIQSL